MQRVVFAKALKDGARGVPWSGDSMGYACFTGSKAQMQRGRSRNPGTSLPLAWDTEGEVGSALALAAGSHKRLLRQGERDAPT